MYFKDTTLPKMVTSVRPPLIPDGYQADNEIKSDDFLKNPLFIGGIVLIIIIILMIWKK
jgi:hypothetical protein